MNQYKFKGSKIDNAYLLVVETLGVLLGLVLGLLFVDIVKALGLDELVDLSTGEGSNELLGELVVDRLALLALSLLKGVHGSERGTTSEDLVRELTLVVVVVSLVVGVGRFTWKLSVLVVAEWEAPSDAYPSRTF